jgi:AmmeMemoRadiSam system protein A
MKKELLLEIAKSAILNEFTKKELNRDAILKKYPELGEKGAVFVTLKKGGDLRGCIGSLIAYRSLLEDIISNAKASAFHDPRFKPLDRGELSQIDIEISILSPYKMVMYRDKEDLKRKIRPNIDGVILKLGTYQATFLPQVWETLPDFDLFFANLCRKAGVESLDCLDKQPTIFVYQVEKVSSEQ